MATETSRHILARISKLERQGLEIAVNIGTVAGTLEKKGMYAAQEEVMQRLEDISEKYSQKRHALKEKLDNPSPKDAFAAIRSGIFAFLGITKRDSAFQAKANEIFAVIEEGNQELSRFFTEISERYGDIDALPDIPRTRERADKVMSTVGRQLVKVFEPDASVPRKEGVK